MGLSFPPGHIEANFADDCLRRHNVDSIDTGKINTANSYQFCVKCKSGRIALCFLLFPGCDCVWSACLGGRFGPRWQRLEMRLDLPIAFCNLLMTKVVSVDLLLQ